MPEIRRIGQVAVTVKDLERATAFYRDRLGLRYLFSAPPGMAFFDCGGTRILLGTTATTGEIGGAQLSSILYFDTPDIHTAHGDLEARGVAFRQPPEKVADLGDRELWLALFDDGEGNVMALMSEPPKR